MAEVIGDDVRRYFCPRLQVQDLERPVKCTKCDEVFLNENVSQNNILLMFSNIIIYNECFLVL